MLQFKSDTNEFESVCNLAIFILRPKRFCRPTLFIKINLNLSSKGKVPVLITTPWI